MAATGPVHLDRLDALLQEPHHLTDDAGVELSGSRLAMVAHDMPNARYTRLVQPVLESLLLLQAPGDLDPDTLEQLEAFLVAELAAAGVWKGRASDGVPWACCKAVEETRVRTCGHVWEVSDQSLHGFWLDVEKSHGAKMSWTLHYDIDGTRLAPRRARDTVHVIQDPAEVSWKVTLTCQS